MTKYILKRLTIGLVTMAILITVTFFLERIIPGSPFINDDDTAAAVKAYEALNIKYGLDTRTRILPIFGQLTATWRLCAG